MKEVDIVARAARKAKIRKNLLYYLDENVICNNNSNNDPLPLWISYLERLQPLDNVAHTT